MTPQHPAAPEGETDARLTEAERDALRGLAFTVPDRVRLEAVVERIVAERLRVVEGERDAARAEMLDGMLAAGHDLEQAWSRAESAEAAHAALVAGVEALAVDLDRGDSIDRRRGGPARAGAADERAHEVHVATHVAAARAAHVSAAATKARAEALREFADTRGVNVGDEDDEWWRGYRQAQRECLHDAIARAASIARGDAR